ncbi:CD2 antigen cytoplasmic tail-binding protein 2 homolog [Cylas formicarius]|uniref:CD2 antigen cytoplasmic tail-binding protein 2 homolog n=1 Tax=Cylas formicarius TaxID=197179 RepID=UPI0029588DD1|nr:CD2 antigen cytoplasmic tail-binding protein 2 homolog [Cylas formicarius]
MSKRKHETQFSTSGEKRVAANLDEGKKHTLDSDEEDFADDDNVLHEDDIEGEEDGIARHEGEQRMTAFNMKEEMEEGHFDKQGHFIWNNEKEIRDNWLDNIDWQKIKHNSESANKYDIDDQGLGGESDSDDESEVPFDEINTYRKMIAFMKPKESVNKAIKRLGDADMKLSSIERLRRKKAGTLKTNEDVANLTELADLILTKLGNMDIYQETFEQISSKIDRSMNKNKNLAREAELDMYADDFEEKEKEKLKDEPSTSFVVSLNEAEAKNGASSEHTELLWEFKSTAQDNDISGPYNTAQMIKWQKENYFKPGTMVRKYGEDSNFYSLSRIDFELYE